MKFKLFILMFLLFSIAFMNCTPKSDAWVKYESPDKKFSIEFPGTPFLSESDVESSFGPTVNHSIHFDETSENTPEFLFYADYMDLGKSISADSSVNEYFENMMAATSTAMGFKKYNEKNIELNGYPGREYVIDINKDHVVIKCRIYLAGERLYMLQVGTYNSQINKPDITRFFNSFRLTD